MIISPDMLVETGFLKNQDVRVIPEFSPGKVEYEEVFGYKKKVLARAFEYFHPRSAKDRSYQDFCREQGSWLNDFAIFMASKEFFGGRSWTKWPRDLRDREGSALRDFSEENSAKIEEVKFFQYLFFSQWKMLREYARSKGIKIIGDIPIYVNHDSAEVWTNRGLFKLESSGEPKCVGGVPPDYFSATGQRWGNPVYDWPKVKDTGYAWWIQRMAHNLELFDHVRIDHFRGFAAYWEIPASEETAVKGYWVDGPREDLFNVLLARFPVIPVIAEDMGIITQDVRDLMNKFGFPGMRVLHFAFGDDMQNNPYLPHNYISRCLVYTGTHDNNTTRGWFEYDVSELEKKNLSGYLHKEPLKESIHEDLVRLAMTSAADVVLIPMQDFLGLGRQARMNVPGTLKGNWRWRLSSHLITRSLEEKIRNWVNETRRVEAEKEKV